MAFQFRLTRQVTRQVMVDHHDVSINHSGQALDTQGNAHSDDQEGEDRPHVSPQPVVSGQEKIGEQDGDQQRTKHRFKTLEQVQACCRDQQHEGQSAQSEKPQSAAQDGSCGRRLLICCLCVRQQISHPIIKDIGIGRFH